jgi:hypothetical protein
MARTYTVEFLKQFEVLEENYKEKKVRDRRAKELRKQGYSVDVESVNFSWADGSMIYYIHATRPRSVVHAVND